MENIVSGFFKNSFTQEQQTLLYRGLGIAEVFNIGVPVTSAIQEKVMREQETQKEDIIDAIWDIINEGTDKIIFAHRITLNEGASLSFKLTILENLFAFSHRETYQPFATILSNWEFSNEEKLCKILAELSGEDESYFQEYVEWVYVGTLNRLHEFVENKVKEEEIVDELFQSTNKKIDPNKNELTFLFNNRNISIYKLSSGEKQILLILLTILLQDNKQSIIFMDEPEISLHFDWQKKIIEFARKLNPNSQLIIATHSPAVIMEGWIDKVVNVEDLRTNI